MGIPGLSRLDHIGFTVPDLDQAHDFLVDVLGCEYLYRLGPFASDEDWMAEHLAVDPRAVMRELRFYRLGGQAVFGPDLEFVEAPDYSVDPARAAAFADYIRKFWPALPAEALQPDYAGVRPKLHGPDEPQPDFRIDGPETHGLEALVVLFGIESPGLTSSLAIGEEVAGRLGL